MQQCTAQVSVWVCCRLHFLACRGALKHLHKEEITPDTFLDPIPDLKGLHPAAQICLAPLQGLGYQEARLPSSILHTLCSDAGVSAGAFFFTHICPFSVPSQASREDGEGGSEMGTRAQSSRGDYRVVQKVGSQETRPGGVCHRT